MSPKTNPTDSVKKVDSELEIDEDVEIEFDDSSDRSRQRNSKDRINRDKGTTGSLNHGSKKREDVIETGMKRSTIAGILMIIAFILSLIFPVYFIITIQEVQNATGDTVLEGRIRDQDNKPVANVTISISNTDFLTMSDQKGEYRIENIPVGEHRIEFSKPGYRSIVVEKTLFSEGFLSQADLEANTIDIPGNLTSGLKVDAIEGLFEDKIIVNDDYNSTLFGKIMNSSGSGINNLMIKIEGTNITSVTDESGNYYISGLKPGIITLHLEQMNNANLTKHTFLFASNRSVQLNLTFLEDTPQVINEILGTSATISGQVKDQDGDSVDSVNITLMRLVYNEEFLEAERIGELEPNTEGEFLFENLPADIYQISIIGIDHSILIIDNITVNDNSTVDLGKLKITKFEDEVLIEEEILNEYTIACIAILFIFALLTLLGGISAIQQKRYSLAFFGAITGMAPLVIYTNQANICGATLISLLAFVLLVFSRNEFEFKKK
jgi:hypothetical protein